MPGDRYSSAGCWQQRVPVADHDVVDASGRHIQSYQVRAGAILPGCTAGRAIMIVIRIVDQGRIKDIAAGGWELKIQRLRSRQHDQPVRACGLELVHGLAARDLWAYKVAAKPEPPPPRSRRTKTVANCSAGAAQLVMIMLIRNARIRILIFIRPPTPNPPFFCKLSLLYSLERSQRFGFAIVDLEIVFEAGDMQNIAYLWRDVH